MKTKKELTRYLPVLRTFGLYSLFILLLAGCAATNPGIQGGAAAVGISVTDFGAAGDGVTDDTEALRRAIDAAEERGEPLLVPSGRYLISDDIALESSLQIHGAGHEESVFTSNGEKFRLMIRHSNISIRDLGFEDMVEPIALDSREGHSLENIVIERSRFENIETTSTNRGVIGLSDGALWQRQYPIRHLTVRDCIFRDIHSSAINIRANISNAQLIGNQFYSLINLREDENEEGPLGGFAIRLGESADDAEMLEEFKTQGYHLIQGNVIRHMRKYTVPGYLTGFLIYGDFNIIRNNVLEDIDGTDIGHDVNAMYIRGAYNRVLENTIRNIRGSDDDGALSFKGGVSRGSQYSMIADNVIQHIYGMSGVEVSTSHIQVKGNIIEDVPVRGFTHRTGKDLWLQNNTFIDADVDLRTGRREGEGEAFVSGNRFLNSELQLSQYRRALHIPPRDAVYIHDNLFRNSRPGARMIRMASNVEERFVSIKNNRFQNVIDDPAGRAIGRMVDLETAGRVREVEIIGNHIIQKGPHNVLFHIGDAAGTGRFSDNRFLIHDLRGPVLAGSFHTVENNTVRIAGNASEEVSIEALFVMEGYSPDDPMVFRNNRIVNEAEHVNIGSITRWETDFSESNGPGFSGNRIQGHYGSFGSFNHSSLPEVEAVNNHLNPAVKPLFVAAETDDPSNMAFPGRGKGTAEDPYQISNARELQAMRSDLAAHYILVQDIDASGTSGWNDGAGFDPIGEPGAGFTGTLDGNGHVISGLTIQRPDESHVGLIGKMGPGGRISRIGLEGANVSGFYGVGSLIGLNQEGSVSESFSRCEIRGYHDTGGLIGHNELGRVTDSYSECEVTGRTDVGGLIGFSSGKVINSWSAGAVEARARTYGMIGYLGTWIDETEIRNSYWDIDRNDKWSPWSPGLSTAEMFDIATYLDTESSPSWSIAPMDRYNGETWKIDQGNDYPVLGWEK